MEEEILKYIEKEEAEFRQHWLFQELNCSPAELFASAREYSEKHNIEIPVASNAITQMQLQNPIAHINFNRLTVLRA